MDEKLAKKFQKMYGPNHDDVSWVDWQVYPKLPLVQRVWLRVKRVANYKIF